MALNIDDFIPQEDSVDKITEQVNNISRSHGQTFPRNYALSWVIANQVVQRYYGRFGIDAVPIWRDNFGWAQFNLTQATNCLQPINKTLESQRYIVFDAIAINWAKQGDGDAQIDVYNSIEVQNRPPVLAVNEAVAHLDLDNQEPFDHSACLHGPHAYAYTKLFQVVTDLACKAPELVIKREINIDIDPEGKVREEITHPLRQLNLAQSGLTRDWFELFHIPANTYVYINVFTGDLAVVNPDGKPHALDYPGWNELNDEQVNDYFARMLNIEPLD